MTPQIGSGSMGAYRDGYGPFGARFAYFAPAYLLAGSFLLLMFLVSCVVMLTARPELVAQGNAGESVMLIDKGSDGYVLWADFDNPRHDSMTLRCETSAPTGETHVYSAGSGVPFARDLGDPGWLSASVMRDPKKGEVMTCTGNGLRRIRVTRDIGFLATMAAIPSGPTGAIAVAISMAGMRMRRRMRLGTPGRPGS